MAPQPQPSFVDLLKLIPSVLKLHHVFMIIWIHILHLSELIDVLKYGEHGISQCCAALEGEEVDVSIYL